MHAQFSGRSHLISSVLPENSRQEELLKFRNRLGVLDSAAVHSKDKVLKLFLQGKTSLLDKLKDPKGFVLGFDPRLQQGRICAA